MGSREHIGRRAFLSAAVAGSVTIAGCNIAAPAADTSALSANTLVIPSHETHTISSNGGSDGGYTAINWHRSGTLELEPSAELELTDTDS